jgi:hypothetical protein
MNDWVGKYWKEEFLFLDLYLLVTSLHVCYISTCLLLLFLASALPVNDTCSILKVIRTKRFCFSFVQDESEWLITFQISLRHPRWTAYLIFRTHFFSFFGWCFFRAILLLDKWCQTCLMQMKISIGFQIFRVFDPFLKQKCWNFFILCKPIWLRIRIWKFWQ